MKKEDVIANIRVNYSNLGIPEETIERLIDSGRRAGLSYSAIYTGIRYMIAQEYNTSEIFTVEDVAEILEVSIEEAAQLMNTNTEHKPTKYYIPPNYLNS